jgi:pimeloyl-ACP methyl ester carboxylesterase
VNFDLVKNLDVTLDQLAKCTAPMLFIHGSKEVEATKLRAALIVEELGRGELKVIEGTDHMTTLLDPEFGDTIDEFLEGIGRE